MPTSALIVTRMRTSRTSDNKSYEYVYSGDKLVQMTIKNHATNNTEQLLEFTYDAAGQPLTLTLDNVIYYYLLNIQGDVMGLVDGSGNLMTAFSYTAYGKAYSLNNVSSISSTLASANPLTYRGYILDTGTGHYYLQSRYYDPTLGRFINGDGFTTTGQGLLGNNMFIYCLNNPIIYIDPTGHCSYLGSIHAPRLDCRRLDCPESSSYCPEAIDLTETLTSFMEENAKQFSEYIDTYGPVDAALYFHESVTDGGPLDIKLQEDWQFEEDKVYIFNGQQLRKDDPGNINYGYVGSVHFSLDVLLFFAGAHQVSKYRFKYGDLSTWYDDPRDQDMIKWGVQLYKEARS